LNEKTCYFEIIEPLTSVRCEQIFLPRKPFYITVKPQKTTYKKNNPEPTSIIGEEENMEKEKKGEEGEECRR
jgi:hypothetical protein